MVQLEKEAIIGLAVGFGSIVGGIFLCCCLWHCCCGDKDKSKRRKPTGPWMEMCNNSACGSDTGSNKTTNTLVSREGKESRNTLHKNEHYDKLQKPLKAPYKSSLHSEMYPSNPSNMRHNHMRPTDWRKDNLGVSDMDDDCNSAQPASTSPQDWYNVNTPSPKDLNSLKNNPELLYQRYLY